MRSPRTPLPAAAAAIVTVVAVLVTACTAPAGTDSGAPQAASPAASPAQWGLRIERTIAHDRTAFTQGLEIADGRLFEGTGLVGRSQIIATDQATGVTLARADLPEPLFGEGITLARSASPPTLWQLTWRNGVAIARDPTSLAEMRRVPIDVEGWGVCALTDGTLISSDGSATLTVRDPTTFAALSTVAVTAAGAPRSRLNELECTPDGVYANVWQTDTVVLIDPSTGVVRAEIDAAPLRAALGSEADGVDVLNGIAAIPGTDRFLMTGKLWPSMFEVTLIRR